jgi:hypothetical protein
MKKLLLLFAITYSSLGKHLFAKNLHENKKLKTKPQRAIKKTRHHPA